ncbi:hypothetical protein CDEST_15486 [Colletotrichum destructivum]|uniref:Uncharacterized protein n=1 Tax=Colletotrichum destructivum TaxID=34406 RepID=A0AAX4J4G2_9PEZI|nr:hypothetical protein CDEST_15486 [Colletotrichum destructivum]
MDRQEEIQTWQDIPRLDLHSDPVKATQTHFSTSRHLQHFPLFPLNFCDEYQSNPTNGYQLPPNTFDSTELSFQNGLSLLSSCEEPYRIEELPPDHPTSACTEFEDRDRFIIEARAEKLPWKSISKTYQDCFEVSNASTPQALVMRSSRLKKMHPELRAGGGNVSPVVKEAKKATAPQDRRSRQAGKLHTFTMIEEDNKDERAEDEDTDPHDHSQEVSSTDAVLATEKLLSFLVHPDVEHIVSPDDCMALVRIKSRLRSQLGLGQG